MSDNTSVPSERTTSRKVRQGVVVSDVQDKTIVVRVDRRTTHPLYGKSMRVSKKYHVHDETNDAGVGDTVRIVETRPLSKLKRWRLQSVVERAK
jgi:small subunit ribosomal protein S17